MPRPGGCEPDPSFYVTGVRAMPMSDICESHSSIGTSFSFTVIEKNAMLSLFIIFPLLCSHVLLLKIQMRLTKEAPVEITHCCHGEQV